MKKEILFLLFLSLITLSSVAQTTKKFLYVHGEDIVTQQGTKFHIKGTNLGNWLNPEGYMFGLKRTNSARQINEMFCELVGPDFTSEFWKKFKDSYITKEDIDYIARIGSNTIRLPFNYRLFTDEDYMGLTSHQDGFARVDSIVKWCRKDHLYIILDMHDAPGGQTGDNIDDSYGYPWIFKSSASQSLLCEIWKKIALYYCNEPVILGYELLNEPIPNYMKDREELNKLLEPLYKMAVKAIRKVDTNHIILLGGSQWNTNFKPFSDWMFDKNIMYTCHRYGGDANVDNIREYLNFRSKTGLPMYMGEIGHNTYEWTSKMVQILNDNNIGWTFWPYKKMGESSFVGFEAPANWKLVTDFSEAQRFTFSEIQKARPLQDSVKESMNLFIENCKFSNCFRDTKYIQATGLKP